MAKSAQTIPNFDWDQPNYIQFFKERGEAEAEVLRSKGWTLTNERMEDQGWLDGMQSPTWDAVSPDGYSMMLRWYDGPAPNYGQWMFKMPSGGWGSLGESTFYRDYTTAPDVVQGLANRREGYKVATTRTKYAMVLLTKEILDAVPPLYSQDGKGMDALVYAKFFTPDSNWTWLMTEYDPVNREAFGYVQGFEGELGYFSIDELEYATGPMGLHIERDMSFPVGKLTLAKAMEQEGMGRVGKKSSRRPTSSLLACRPRRRAFKHREAQWLQAVVDRIKSWFGNLLDVRESAIDELDAAVAAMPKEGADHHAQSDADADTAALLREWLSLKEQVKEAEARLGEIKGPLKEEFERANNQSLRVDEIAYIALGKKSSPQYKIAFTTALTKVNAATKAILDNLLAENTTEVDVFNVRPVKP